MDRYCYEVCKTLFEPRSLSYSEFWRGSGQVCMLNKLHDLAPFHVSLVCSIDWEYHTAFPHLLPK